MNDLRLGGVPVEQLGDRAAGLQRMAGLVGLVGLALCVVGALTDRHTFFGSYLWAFFYWTGFTFGSLGVLLLTNVVGGKWGVVARRVLEASMRNLPLIVLLFLPLFFGMRDLYPWAQPEMVAHSSTLRHKAPYLNLTFWAVRAAFYFAFFSFLAFRLKRWFDEQDRTGEPLLRERMRAFSAPGVLFFVVFATFAYIDWVLSMEVEFYSTVYGAMLLIGQVLQSFALAIIVLVYAGGRDRFQGILDSKLLHDLGNLMFAFTIFWTYLSASQLIIVWPGNLPQEIGWYLDRIRGGWVWVAAFIAIFMFLTPFLLLLSQERKRNPRRLIRVAWLLLVARMLDLYWIIQPSMHKQGFSLHWTDVAAFAGVGGAWIFLFLRNLRSTPLLPLRDPRIAPVLTEAA